MSQVCYEPAPLAVRGTRIQSVARRRALHGTLALPSYFSLLESSFHPATELEANNVIHGPPLGDGWSTSNYVQYPQTLLIEFFADACSLRRIVLLSHETKIPSTVEIFAGLATRRRLDDESVAEAKQGSRALQVQSARSCKFFYKRTNWLWRS